MSKKSPAQQRAIRIELLRARAAIERQGVVHGVNHLRDSLTPRGLLESVFPKKSRRTPRASPSDWLLRGWSYSRRYPMLLSLGSTLLSTGARRKLRWWKYAAAAVLAWQVSRNLRK